MATAMAETATAPGALTQAAEVLENLNALAARMSALAEQHTADLAAINGELDAAKPAGEFSPSSIYEAITKIQKLNADVVSQVASIRATVDNQRHQIDSTLAAVGKPHMPMPATGDVDAMPAKTSDVAANRPTATVAAPTATHQVADYTEGQSIESTEFEDIQCNNVTPTGISYWTRQAPASKYVLIKFTFQERVVYVTAEVLYSIHHSAGHHSAGSGALYRVGCRFVKRL